MNKAKRKLVKDTSDLATIFSLLSFRRLRKLSRLPDHYAERESDFSLDGFLAAFKNDVPSDALMKLDRILRGRKSHGTMVALIGLLRDSFELARKTHASQQ